MVSAYTLMQLAISAAKQGISKGQSPFGCAIAIGDRIITSTHNHVLAHTDITAHAEIHALRLACKAENNIFLEGAHVAATCEPCPMCMTALHWARVDTVYYGASIADATEAGFNELNIPAQQILQLGSSPVTLINSICQDDCKSLFSEWLQNKPKAY
ncbi:MAG: nucleoside deaminase [Pseudomonadales bacterium]|nr:nucleoside deaminase [Pseudomonadales bacterium]